MTAPRAITPVRKSSNLEGRAVCSRGCLTDVCAIGRSVKADLESIKKMALQKLSSKYLGAVEY